ncbi:hypothetical protein QQZ08_005716 [Neonectria magnoliae]|uniref:Uncharacterized protein n=1 Tax=Neonectria magnoliae TaxID=2732573 RepID=A0ABR1I2N7_9HYPO
MASDLGFVGARIQLAPNLARILTRLRYWDSIDVESTDVLEARIRDGASNEELTHVTMNNIREKHGYPHCTEHRSSLSAGLYEACKNARKNPRLDGISDVPSRALTNSSLSQPSRPDQR